MYKKGNVSLITLHIHKRTFLMSTMSLNQIDDDEEEEKKENEEANEIIRKYLDVSPFNQQPRVSE